MAERKEQCPDCGRWFVNLVDHKICRGKGDSKGKRQNSTKCLECGKWFADLCKHKVCHGRRGSSGKRPETSKDQWLYCEKWFDDLDNHKVCHGRRGSSDKRHENTRDQCPYCEKWFVDLDNHKVCHGRRGSSYKRQENTRDQCPYCEKWFVDLDNHKVCHGRRGSSDKRHESTRDQCPYCEKWFVDLDNHKVCHGRRGSSDKRHESTRDQCPYCEKWFVDLDNHKICHGRRGSSSKRQDSTRDQCYDRKSSHSMVSDGLRSSQLSSSIKIDVATRAKLDSFVTSMVNKGVINYSVNPRSDIKRFFRDEVQLRMEEIQTAAKHFNSLQQDVVDFLDSRTNWSWSAFRAGSHYDGTKVSRPNEMDCVLVPDLRVELEPVYRDCVEGFCKVKVRSPSPEIRKLCDGRWINKAKYRQFIFGIMDKFVKEYSKGGTRCKTNLTHPSSPSYGVMFDVVSRSLHIDVDFVPVLHLPSWPPRSIARDLRTLHKGISPHINCDYIMEQGVNLVTKRCDGSPDDQDLQWKISCSYAEKKLTYHGENSCWKPVMRTMKRMVEIAKGIDGLTFTGKSLEIQKAAHHTKTHYLGRSDFRLSFHSYCIRSLMWYLLYDLTAGDHVWRDDTQESKLHFSLGKLQQMITGEIVVPHFFIPGIRDIMAVRTKDREFMYILVKATGIVFSRSPDRRGR